MTQIYKEAAIAMMREETDPSVPVVAGIPIGDRLVVLCPFCQQVHTHGRGDGHRIAHCLEGPRRGYVIEVVGA